MLLMPGPPALPGPPPALHVLIRSELKDRHQQRTVKKEGLRNAAPTFPVGQIAGDGADEGGEDSAPNLRPRNSPTWECAQAHVQVSAG